jgi:LacI family transcriptional regulator
MGFRSALRSSGRTIFDISETRGLDEGVAHAAALLQWNATDVCVYSIGGGNRSLLQALDEAGVQCHTFIAHDLDAENRELLSSRRISAVVHHDLARDMNQAISVVLQENGLAAPTPVEGSPLWVITPENIPPTGF